MASASEEIFSDKFTKQPDSDMKGSDEKTVEEDLNPDINSEFPPIPNTDSDPAEIPPDAVDDEPSSPPNDSNGSRKKGIIGAIVIGLIIGGAFYGAETMGLFGDSEPFDSSECHYGVHQDFFGERCITQEEFESMQDEPEEQTPAHDLGEPTNSGNGGTKDVSSASDKVELEKTNDILGYYVITSSDDWYGDYVDFRKIPSKIEESGNMKINFRCYKDDFTETSTYFATFRNVIEPNLTVEVFINGLEVETESTTTNKALILEGSCYGHES